MMKRIAILLAMLPLTVFARQTVRIACHWDFAPYEFINTEGESDGFTIDVFKAIFETLDYPCQFVMNSTDNSTEAFLRGDADLIVDYDGRFAGDSVFHSLNALGYFNLALAVNKEAKPIVSASELKGQEVIVSSGADSIAANSIGRLLKGALLKPLSPREALAGIADGDCQYFIFGQEPLKWKLKEYNLRNVTICQLDLPTTEINIIAHDKRLIEAIDDEFARLQQSGRIDHLNNRWFHPERRGHHASPYLKYIVLAILLLAILVYAIYRIAKSRLTAAVRRYEDSEATMHRALTMGQFSVFINDLRQGRLFNQHGNELPDEGVTIAELRDHLHPDDRNKLSPDNLLDHLLKGSRAHFSMRWSPDIETEDYHTIAGYSYPEYDENGKPTSTLVITKDVTAEVEHAESERALAKRYIKMFDSALVAMSFYDKEGHLVDLNQNMMKLCGLTEENRHFFSDVKFYNMDQMKGDFDPNNFQNAHFCQHMHYPQIGLDKYIEMRIRPINDEKGQLVFFLITAREATQERNMYLELKRQQQAIGKAATTNQQYERELRILLDNCDMYVWHCKIDEGLIYFSRSIHENMLVISLQDYADRMYPEFREQALANISRITTLKSFNFIRRFHHNPLNEQPTWFSVSGMPLTDEQGNVTELFGIVRDTTNLMEAQEKLKEETARAENSALLKSTFLANMTHEIRTPLNAIVGFSDVLQMVGDPSERKEILHIIRNNCDMLLRLVHDIIEASAIEVKSLTVRPQDVDFAAEFQTVCQSLAQRVQKPGVQFIVDAPFTTFKTFLDMGRIQQVVTNFVTNAVKYTHQGHIKVGYRYEDGGLYIYCEDTGQGIPKEKQARVFDRFVKLNDFVQGTGLGLAICKSIAERCGGKIGLNSEGAGQGCTFWIWIPVTAPNRP